MTLVQPFEDTIDSCVYLNPYSCLSSGHISGRTPSMREQLSGSLYASNPVPVPPASTTGPPRTLFGRLGIRKPSLLSLTSPLVPPAHTARTFSLDDLLKPPTRSKKHPVPVFTVLEPGLVNVHTPLTLHYLFTLPVTLVFSSLAL